MKQGHFVEKTNNRGCLFQMTTRHSNRWLWEAGLGNPPDSMLFSHDAVKFACKLCDITDFMPLDDPVMRHHSKSVPHVFALHNDNKTTLEFWTSLGNTTHSIHLDDTVFMCKLCNNGSRYPNNLRAMYEHHRSEGHNLAKALAFVDTIAYAQKREREQNNRADLEALWEEELGNPKGSLEWVGESFYKCGVCGSLGLAKTATAEGMIRHCRTTVHQRLAAQMTRVAKRSREEEEEEELPVTDQDEDHGDAKKKTKNTPVVEEESLVVNEIPQQEEEEEPSLHVTSLEEDPAPNVAAEQQRLERMISPAPAAAPQQHEQTLNSAWPHEELVRPPSPAFEEIFPPVAAPAPQGPRQRQTGRARALFLQACDKFLEGQRTQIAQKCAKILSK
jgi:hypothetical protein